jgi:hypothetical protein
LKRFAVLVYPRSTNTRVNYAQTKMRLGNAMTLYNGIISGIERVATA